MGTASDLAPNRANREFKRGEFPGVSRVPPDSTGRVEGLRERLAELATHGPRVRHRGGAVVRLAKSVQSEGRVDGYRPWLTDHVAMVAEFIMSYR